MIPGIKITDRTLTAEPPGTRKIDSILLVVARREQFDGQRMSTRDHWITEVPSITDIDPMMGAVSAPVTDAYRTIRHLAPEARIFMVGAHIQLGGSMTHITDLVNEIENPEVLPLSVILCPELDLFSGGDPSNDYQARIGPRRALAQFAQRWEHLYYFNLGPEIYSLGDAIAVCRYCQGQMDLSQGHTSAWYGWADGRHQLSSLAVDAAAYTINQNQFLSGVYVPAGELIYTSEPVNASYQLDFVEAGQALELGLFNFPFHSPRGWLMSGDSTLGTAAWGWLSNRLASSIFRQRLINRFAAYAFQNIGTTPIGVADIDGGFLGPLVQECDRALRDRVLRSYEVLDARPDGQGVNLGVRIQPFGSVHMLDIDLKGERHE